MSLVQKSCAPLMALGGLTLLLGCQREPKAPDVSPASVIEAALEGQAESRGRLELVHHAPTGEAALVSTVQLLFNRPLRGLTEADAGAQATLTPTPPGAWHWTGTQGLRFVPAGGRLPGATEFTVHISANIRSTDGLALSPTQPFIFRTPRPAVLRTLPPIGSTGLGSAMSLTVVFNQRVTPDAVQTRGHLWQTDGNDRHALPFTTRACRAEQRPPELDVDECPRAVLVTPAAALPLDSQFTWSLDPGLQGAEGPLPSEDPFSASWSTYGPLTASVNCQVRENTEGCDPEGRFWIETNNPVHPSDLERLLTIAPTLPRKPAQDYGPTRYHFIDLLERPVPGQTYEITVRQGLADEFGQTLGHRVVRVLPIGDYTAVVQSGIRGEVFLPPLTQIPLRSRNQDEIRVYTHRFTPDSLLRYFGWRGSEQGDARSLLSATPLTFAGDADNSVEEHSIELGDARGPVWLGYELPALVPSEAESTSALPRLVERFLQVTDLGISAKLSSTGAVVWVTRLGSGQSVQGARVRVIGHHPEVQLEAATDEQGLARFSGDFLPSSQGTDATAPDTTLWVEANGDVSVKALTDFIPSWELEPAVDLSKAPEALGLLFTDRAVYRPGDNVELKGIVRYPSRGADQVQSGRTYSLVLLDPLGAEISRTAVTTSAFGTFSARLPLPASAPLGTFSIETRGLGGSGGADEARTSLDVAEYRPNEFEVKVRSEAPQHLPDSTARFHVSGQYLFGAPMTGAKVEYDVSRGPGSYAPPGTEGWVTGDTASLADEDSARLDSVRLRTGTAALDALGEYELALPLKLPGQTGPEEILVEVQVSDASNQAVAARTRVIAHPADHYVALKAPKTHFVSAPTTLQPELRVVAPDGTPRAAVPVDVQLLERRWTVARQRAQDGTLRTQSQREDVVRARCRIVSSAQPLGCPLLVPAAGSYFIRATARDGRGHTAYASYDLYAAGAGPAAFPDNDQRQIALMLDRDSYREGELAEILVRSPFKHAEALLTVEGAGLERAERVTLTGPSTTLKLPVTASMGPNAFVGLHVLEPLPLDSAQRTQALEPGYRVGYASLRVDPSSARLDISLSTDRPDYGPSDRVQIRAKASDANGNPQVAELTLYAVDEGVLALAPYSLPSPLDHFTAPRPLRVATLETRRNLGVLSPFSLEQDKEDYGGDGGEGSAGRHQFATTPLFAPAVVTDANGEAALDFRLPDNLTRFRLMAVGVTAGTRYGAAATSLTVRKPVLLRPALPRKMRAGDVVVARVLAHSDAPLPEGTRVEASVIGGHLESPATAALEGANAQVKEASFRVRVPSVGQATFTFQIHSALGDDRVSLTRDVQSPTPLETSALYGQTDLAEAQLIGDLTKVRSDLGGLEVRLASTALVGLDGPLRELIDYPYACTEQLTSALLPLTQLRPMAERYGLALPENLPHAIEASVGEILNRQLGSGGFGLWPYSRAHRWTSAYALTGLWTARQAGAYVPERAFELGKAYLRQWLGEDSDGAADLAARALALDTLAELGAPDTQRVLSLFAARQALPLSARALLLRAAHKSRAPAEAIATLRSEVEAAIEPIGNRAQIRADAQADAGQYAQLFDSPTRAAALALDAILAVDPQHPMAAPLARGLLAQRRASSFGDTQATAYTLLALDHYRRSQEATLPQFDARVWLGQNNLLRVALDSTHPSQAWSRPMNELDPAQARLTFEKVGSGTLFYEARLRYAGNIAPASAREEGFSVRKAMRRVDLSSLPAALETVGEQLQPELKAGDLALVDIVVATSGTRHFVAVADPLPAGLEPVDTSLATTAQGLSTLSEDTPSQDDGYSWAWHHRELRDDKALFFFDEMPPGVYLLRYLARATTRGEYTAPPTHVSEMYQPEVFGRTASTSLVIR